MQRPQQHPRRSGKRALVVGVGSYTHAPLTNTLNDATDMHAALKRMGFEAALVLDCDIEALYEAVRAFMYELQRGDIAVFFFAGHGVEHQDTNWLICKEVPKDQKTLPLKAYDVQKLLQEMQERQTYFNLIILDCCRNSPLPSSARGVMGGLCALLAPKGSMICFACAPKQVASDGSPSDRNGIFTKHLLKHIEVPDQPVQARKDPISARSAHTHTCPTLAAEPIH